MTFTELLQRTHQILRAELVVIAGTPITVMTLVILAAIVIITFKVAGLLQRAVERHLMKRSEGDMGTAGVVSRLLRYIVLVVGLSIGLNTAGINLSALFAAGALFAVAIGFAMQNVVANFVSGIILLTERVIKPGDILEVEGQMVRVHDMGIRATLVRTQDDEDLVLPNSTLVQSTVKNFTLQDRLYRLRVAVGVAYSSDLHRVRETIETAISAVDWRSPERDPVLLLSEFGSSSVDYEASVWIEDPWNNRTNRSQLREAIWWALKDADITIAFPQVDVHFDEPVVEGIRGRAVA